jgi:lactate dehydrogenase-like 2-hydroxyacid dehydrogenase
VADDQLHVLVPEQAAAALRSRLPQTVRLHTYRYLPKTRSSRVALRFRILGSNGVLDRTWIAPTSTPWHLIRTLWCGPDVQINSDEATTLLSRMPALTTVYWQRTGLDGLPIAVFASHGVSVVNSKGLSSLWVAEAVVACIAADAKFLMFSARNRVPPLDQFTRGFQGLRVAVMGTGHIGTSVARLASRMGMAVTGLTRDPSRMDREFTPFARLRKFPEEVLDTVLDCDYLVLALPSTEATDRIVDDELLRALGPSGVLVNLARPSLVDEAALIDTLRKGGIRAAYLSRLEPRTIHNWRRRLPPNLFLSFNREAHVAEKMDLAAGQFLRLLFPQEL